MCGYIENVQKNRILLLIIDTTLHDGNPVRFRKMFFNLIKMTVADQIKILDDRIKSTPAQYDLGREDAKISVFSSKNRLDQYEYLTGED